MLHILLNASLAVFYYISAPAVYMRMQPSPGAEVVSQGIHSEQVNVIKEADGWTKIETCVDNYPGWIKSSTICSREKPYANGDTPVAIINRRVAHLYDAQDTIYGPLITLPFESKLEVTDKLNDPKSRWIKVSLVDGRDAYVQRGDVKLDNRPLDIEEVVNLCQSFLGLPYTWGGRSGFGYDCSGFVQMLYRQMGINLPRDSKDQIKCKNCKPVSLDNLQTGDLIFFGYSENSPKHVGFYLGDDNFIHATVRENAPYLRISNLNDLEWSEKGPYTYRTARTVSLN
jgi:hypothetical protein